MTKESASPVIQNVAFAVNYFYQLQNSKVIQPMKLLISTIKSTAKAASLITYLSAISAKSITTEKIRKIPWGKNSENFFSRTFLLKCNPPLLGGEEKFGF